VPVFLGRRPAEPVDQKLQAFYAKLLAAINAPIFCDGEWKLCERSGWPNNSKFQKPRGLELGQGQRSASHCCQSQRPCCSSPCAGPVARGTRATWRLIDALSDVIYDRNGA
jgi:hypothetical protein